MELEVNVGLHNVRNRFDGSGQKQTSHEQRCTRIATSTTVPRRGTQCVLICVVPVISGIVANAYVISFLIPRYGRKSVLLESPASV
ncbi:hypothetical protein PsorP6_016499 [Peronosclerospora sorghi]|uniref:Uncharacterized protein n=1 Tax=Peronosclerospora sorghi TaxID=230839 RepID=A0ACC0VPD2_9STRA|nr:hypothetical protein PsorP6_016499 [Peronosclerospora sorghi]